jgi:uncharacterized protein (UPF0218 family)
MSTAYAITPESIQKFKEPFGKLLQGSFSETINQLKELIETKKPSMIISVGDMVSRNLHENNIIPQVSIIDNQSMRIKIQQQNFQNKVSVRVKNPPGTITQEAIDAIKEALLNKRPVQITVDGEEDLLTLIVVLYAPENALVVYGQPREGMVAIQVTTQKKMEAQKILRPMKTDKKNKQE